jgi:ketosteroid isomerase-like protein
MKRNLFLLLAATAIVTSVPVCWGQGQTSQHAKPKSKRDGEIIAAVSAVVEAQKNAWNRGDIEGFMDGYARSSDTIFVSGDSVTRGWQTVHDRYQKNYNSREKMGTLTFSDLEVTVVSKDAAVMVGRWHLQRANDEPHGRFTLIFRKTKQGWKIVHDHTSSAV